jgi:hypothetical protein
MLWACSPSLRGAFYWVTEQILPRFGTEGSEVQILSPRPILQKSKEICGVQSARSLGFSSGIATLEPSARRFKHRHSLNSSTFRSFIDCGSVTAFTLPFKGLLSKLPHGFNDTRYVDPVKTRKAQAQQR